MAAALRIALSVAALAIAGVAVYAFVEHAATAERAAERRALLARDAELSRLALAPGSALACLDGDAGETVENSCERKVFATPQSTAAAVAYIDARLKLLAEAAQRDRSLLPLLASTRRAVGLDRFGVAAHVLSIRDGCTAEHCEAFALVDDAGALKANLKAEVYDQYVSRYVASWSEPATAPAEKPAAVSAVPAAPRVVATVNGQTPIPAVKPGEHWDFPSAASIPAVSIMGSEPALPKGAEAQAQEPNQAPNQTPNQAPAKTTQTNGAGAPKADAPLPPRKPSPQAAPPAAR